MRRVVVTGLGVVSSIGNNKDEVLSSLQESRSGIERMPEMKELGFRCHVGGRVKGLDVTRIPDRALQTIEGVAHVQSIREGPLRTAMTFNAGLGGSNACLVFRKP